MKKLFLTSGIIACMACPAFAEISTTNGAGFPATNGTVTDNGVGDCVQPTIGAFSGSTTLTAKWIANEYEIDLRIHCIQGTLQVHILIPIEQT